jgi:hypothetical protein
MRFTGIRIGLFSVAISPPEIPGKSGRDVFFTDTDRQTETKRISGSKCMLLTKAKIIKGRVEEWEGEIEARGRMLECGNACHNSQDHGDNKQLRD